MSKRTIFLVIFFVLGIFTLISAQQMTTISEIRANPQTWKNAIVTIEGLATKLIGEEQAAGGEYLLKGIQEGIIKIITSKPSPIIGIRYEVTGRVNIEEGIPVIEEQIRIQREENCRIEDILRNPDDYVKSGEVFAVKGQITQLDPEGTNSYFLKDGWGGIIKIRTTNIEDVNIGAVYSISGSIGISTDTYPEEVFISELSRAIEEEEIVIKEKWWKQMKYWLIAAIVLATAFFIIIFITVIKRREVPETIAEFGKVEEVSPEKEEIKEVKIPEPEEVLEGTTIKMAVPPAGTLKMLPGRLIILEGDEKIKEIRFFKTKAEEESEITFGRAAGKPYTHIQLKPMSVSAKQAKLIYAGKKFTLINYASTNPTLVNDIELEENGMVEINEGDKIRMGEVLFEFHVK